MKASTVKTINYNEFKFWALTMSVVITKSNLFQGAYNKLTFIRLSIES